MYVQSLKWKIFTHTCIYTDTHTYKNICTKFKPKIVRLCNFLEILPFPVFVKRRDFIFISSMLGLIVDPKISRCIFMLTYKYIQECTYKVYLCLAQGHNCRVLGKKQVHCISNELLHCLPSFFKLCPQYYNKCVSV